MKNRTLPVVLVVLAAVAGQAGPADAAQLPEHGYVTSAITIPTTSSEAIDLGRDMNGDGKRDNALGKALAVLAAQGIDLAAAANDAVVNGDVVMLHSLRADRLGTTKNATWQVIYGEPTPDPDLSGTGSFTIPLAPTRSARLPATIKEHEVRTAAGTIPISLGVGVGILSFDMVKAKVFATCSGTGCTEGRIAGAVTMDEFHVYFIPKLAELFTAVVARDCPGPGPDSCASGSQGATVESLFDTDQDLVITAQELEDSSLVQNVFAPDLDLAKADGSPGSDGVADAISFGFGFSTVRAQLVRG